MGGEFHILSNSGTKLPARRHISIPGDPEITEGAVSQASNAELRALRQSHTHIVIL